MKSRCKVNPKGVHDLHIQSTRSSSQGDTITIIEVKICVHCGERVESTTEQVRTKVDRWD